MAFTVGEISRLTGVTVRALHHHDEIGLVKPSQRSAAGYRLYGDCDVLRLQQVLVLRELGVPLDEIGATLDRETDRAALLRGHRAALVEKRGRIEAIRREADEINTRLADLMRQSAAPGDPAVQATVEDHRRHISRWYYPCSKEMHHGLGEMYIAEPRFTENLDKVAPGFARFLRDAIAAS